MQQLTAAQGRKSVQLQQKEDLLVPSNAQLVNPCHGLSTALHNTFLTELLDGPKVRHKVANCFQLQQGVGDIAMRNFGPLPTPLEQIVCGNADLQCTSMSFYCQRWSTPSTALQSMPPTTHI